MFAIGSITILLLLTWLSRLQMPRFQAPDLTNLAGVLTWLAGAGGAYVVGKLFAYIAENVPKWHELPRELKFFLPMPII